MIAIINTGTNPSPFGKHTYEVRINKKVICTFTHVREEGLAKCLLLAASAVEKAKCKQNEARMNEIISNRP